ncbi:hypothetical protein FACS1894105_06070 [Clostridia bacterium]|nr:hypothetical protein FACS1894105_06070 [Clostridia bacterium]
MEALKMNRRLPSAIIALIITICAIFYAGTMVAFAAEIPIAATPAETLAETLTVDDVWLTGDTLHIAVTDKTSGGNQTLELNLSDYAKPGDEYVTIQATDSAGRVSNAIQFKNPYYIPIEENTDGKNGENGGNSGNPANASADRTEPSESAVSENGAKPFTPDGTGSVVDNVTEVDGKEFFTVETPDGNVFYLIVDRQRNSENVYLLNAVTEDDLASLAKSGDGKGGSTSSAVTVPETAPSSAPTETTPEPTPAPEPAKSGGNTGMLGIVVVVLIVVGGAGYYFKIVRPKKNGYDYETEDDADDTEADEEYDEPGEEETGDYAVSDDEAVVEEREESEVSGE